MERLLEMLLSGQLPIPVLNAELLALDQALSKTDRRRRRRFISAQPARRRFWG